MHAEEWLLYFSVFFFFFFYKKRTLKYNLLWKSIWKTNMIKRIYFHWLKVLCMCVRRCEYLQDAQQELMFKSVFLLFKTEQFFINYMEYQRKCGWNLECARITLTKADLCSRWKNVSLFFASTALKECSHLPVAAQNYQQSFIPLFSEQS